MMMIPNYALQINIFFLVICQDCCREWIELWRTSKWFIQNNNKNSNY
jgi:hypothetical protein